MRIFVLVLATFALAASAATGAARKEAAPLYGLLTRSGGDDLVRVDPNTLRPVGARLAIGEFGTAWAFSPDRSKLALGWSYTATLGRVGAIRIVDLRRWRSERVISLRGELGSVQAASWVHGRLLALVSYPRDSDVLAIDPRSGRVLGRRTLEGIVAHVVPTVRGLTLLTAPRTGVGSARLVLVDSALRVRSVSLDRVVVGSGVTENDQGEYIAGRSSYAGFALRSGANGALAFVLAAGAPPAVVDLGELSVRYADTRALAARTKTAEGSWRFARLVSDTALVYGGVDYAIDGKQKELPVELLDTRTWEGRVLDPRLSDAVVGSGLILTADFRPTVDRAGGLRAYGTDGRLRFTALPNVSIGDVQIAGRRALVRHSGTRPLGTVLDLASGHTVTTIRGNVPRLLVGRAYSW